MNPEERLKKAFDFSADLTKQLITLATGIIALTITFSHDFLHSPDRAPKGLAYAAWGFFLFSVAAGIMALSALTGNLDARDKKKPLTIYAPNVMLFSISQFLSFGVGLLLTVIFGARSF
jgi:hypothetical protein